MFILPVGAKGFFPTFALTTSNALLFSFTLVFDEPPFDGSDESRQ
jgi:hypothetical protein